MSRLNALANQLKKLGDPKADLATLEAKQEAAYREVRELGQKIRDLELQDRRDTDAAHVREAMDALEALSSDFRDHVASIHRAWGEIAKELAESEEIRTFLARCRELGAQVPDAPKELLSVQVPGQLTPDFSSHGRVSGLEFFRQRIREGKYFQVTDTWLLAHQV